MSAQHRSSVLKWLARLLAIAMTLFVALFALDALNEGPVALFIHLCPALLLALVVALAWERESVAGFALVAIAVLYAIASHEHPDWVLVISVPLAGIGLLFLYSWRSSRVRISR